MATRSLGTLTLDLVARLGGFEAGMDKAAKVSEKRLKEIKATAEKIGKAIGIGLAAGAAGLTALVKHSIDTADEMSKLSRSTGLTTEAISQLQYAANLSGVDDFAGSLNKLNKSVHDAARGLSTPKDAFDDLGISIYGADGKLRSTEDILGDVADAFAHMEDGAKKAGIAQDIFGRSGAQLISFLDSGKAGLAELRREADRYGLTLSGETGKAAEDFNDNLSRIKAQIEGTGNRLTKDLIKPLKDISTIVKDPNFQSGLSSIVSSFAGLAKLSFSGIAKLGEIAQADKLSDAVEQVKALNFQIDRYEHGGAVLRAFGQDTDEALGKLKTQAGDAKKQVDDLVHSLVQAAIGVSANPIVGPDVQIPLRAPSDNTDNPAPKKEQIDAVQQMVAALSEQAATLGYNERALALYKAAGEGATNAQIDQINRLYDNIDAFNEATKATEAYQKEQEDLKALEASFKDAPSFAGIDAVVGGPSGELSKIDDAKKQLEDWYSEQLDLLDQERSDRADLNAKWDDKEAALKQEHEDKLLAIDEARQQARLSLMSDTFGNIAVLSESSNKTLAGIGKAAAIAQATIDGIAAVQVALKSAPPPFNFVIAGAVGVAAAANVAKIAGIGFEQGGYTGNFGRKQVAGLVHGQEFVVNADATAKYRGMLQAMNEGRYTVPTIDTSIPPLPAAARTMAGPQVVVNAPGLIINRTGPVVTVDMVPSLLDVATGRSQVVALQDAQANGPVTRTQNARTGNRRVAVAASRR